MKYGPMRGGHASGDLRTALEETVEAYHGWANTDPRTGVRPPTVIKSGGEDFVIAELCEALTECSDVAPSSLRDEFDALLVALMRDDETPGVGSYGDIAKRLALIHRDQHPEG